MVYRVVVYANADHSCNPYEQDPLYPEQGEPAVDFKFPRHPCIRGVVAIVILISRGFGICAAAFVVLAVIGRYFIVLHGPYPVG